MSALRRPVETTLFVGWWALMTLLPIGHLTGLRNAWTVGVVVITLSWVRGRAWRELPARETLVALLAWCALSIAWSTVPSISFGKWRSDLLIPLLAYAAAYGYVRRTGSMVPLLGGMISGLVALAIISAFAFLPAQEADQLQRFVRTETYAAVENPMPVWYPGVGDASMAAALATGVLVVLRRLTVAIARWALAVGWIALVLVVVATNNRNAEIAIPLVGVACVWLGRRRSTTADVAALPRGRVVARRAVVSASVVALAIVVGLRLESGAAERLVALRVPLNPNGSAFLQLASRDTRPMIWNYYGRLALNSPWIGVGFGRTVPGIHYHTEDDRQLALVESNAYTHAHSLFLNWWLQTGVVGVTMLAAALVQLSLVAWRALRGRRGGTLAHAAGLAMAATLLLMLVRNVTDDFLVYGMATTFWVLMGGLAALGRISEPPER